MKIMKKIIFFISVGILFMLQACYEEYKLDFEYTTTYFPRQFPLRTLVDVEGEEMKFEVGVVLGGKYENNVEELVEFQIQDTLLNNYPDLVKLPDSYYSISSDQIIIPSGEFKGAVTVTLDKGEFMSDELAAGINYALPLEIISSTTDSILQHKQYTIIVIRYYNKYHGWYWLKGVDQKLDANGSVTESTVYSKTDLVSNEDMLLETVAFDSLLVPYIGQFFNDQKGFTMLMQVSDNKCTLEGV